MSMKARHTTWNALLILILLGTLFSPSSAATIDKPFTTRPAITGRAVVTGDNPLSATTAFKILEKGGNAFDAAVAMAATMSLVNQAANDIFGGDAMILAYSAKDKKIVTYNGTGWAPNAATIDRYVEAGGIPRTGVLSVQMPGSFGGWMMLLRDYGTMPLKDILAPAIDVAENGHEFIPFLAAFLKAPGVLDTFNNAAKAIYSVDGKPIPAGTLVRNPDYAKLLRAISDKSYQEAEDYFYRGPVAKQIVEYTKSLGGLLELEDFADFKAEKQEPVTTKYRGVDVYACAPNSQGMVLLEALNILEGYDLKAMGHNSASYIDVLIQALNLSLEDRNQYLGDPRFVKNPMGLITKEYAKVRREKDMHPGKAMDDVLVKGDPTEFNEFYYGNSGDTTFLAVSDAEGNIVACTTSICNAFGSGLMVPGTGILLNNRMNYFFLDDSLPNHLQPRKRTMQTITPSIALKDSAPYLAFGTPGADVQEQAKIQIFLNVVEFGMDPQLAVEAPRVQSRHPMGLMVQDPYPRTIQVEGRVPTEIRDELKKMGYVIQTRADWEYLGFMGMIKFDPLTGRKAAGADPRNVNTAIGW